MKEILIGNRTVGNSHPPLIVAELSANHNGSLERALTLCDSAKEAGCEAIKLQTYTPDDLTLDIHEGDFMIKDPDSLWSGRTYYELYQEAALPLEWHKPIFEHCKKLGLLAFSTPFTPERVEFLESFDVPCYKVASLEMTHHEMIRAIAQTKKPLILSTGTQPIDEIERAVECFYGSGGEDLILLRCCAAYPAPIESLNLNTLPDMAKRFGCLVGLSDHSYGTVAATASTALGAVLIEKHFTLSREDGGPDAAFSLEPHEMKELVSSTHQAWSALGKVTYELSPKEETTAKFKRALRFVRDIQAGESISEKDIKPLRPGGGIAPYRAEEVVGKKARRSIEKGEPVTLNHVES